MEFCKAFNAATQEMEKGMPVPVIITAYVDRSFSFVTKTPPASYYLRKAAKIDKGASAPSKQVAGRVTKAQLREIAEAKMVDLNANEIGRAPSELQSLMRSSYAVFCLKKKKTKHDNP